MAKHILALDQGTTSSRALVVNEHAAIQATAEREFKQFFPQAGWVEHDPEEIWASQYAVALEAMAKANLKASDIAAIGITNQRETTILWDRSTGKPLYPAIVWQDRRTTEQCKQLIAEGLSEWFQQKTGLVIDPYFSLTKLLWLLEHIPNARARAEAGELAFGTIDTWLVWKLTQGALHITDATNASRTLMFNICEGNWDSDILSRLQVPPSLLPTVVDSSAMYGEASVFPSPIPIGAIAGDQQAALFGQGCFHQGQIKATYGTGCFILLHTGNKPVFSRHQLVTTVALRRNQQLHYALEGSVFNAGAAIQWLRDQLKIIPTSADVDHLAASVPSTDDVYFVPAFTGLGAPHWDPHARGTLLGLTRGTSPGHIARATLESIAFQATDVLEAMALDANLALTELRVDGKAANSDLLMQLQADLTGARVLRPTQRELTAVGVAQLAGLSAGVWQSLDDLHGLWRPEKTFEPQLSKEAAIKRLERWKEAVERSKGWAIA
ncbi:MAG: hypothetical protein RL235_896 [Chlamydiota bacterium]|jgi:glycerol kinase